MSSVVGTREYTLLMGAAVLEPVDELLLFTEFEDEKTCESVHHENKLYGHRDSELFYVRFKTCKCAAMGVTIRCKAWMDGVSLRDSWFCATCKKPDNLTSEWFTVLGPVDGGK